MLLLLFARLAWMASSKTVPIAVHLSLGRSPGSFVVTWQTDLLPAGARAFLQYGVHPGALTANASATSTVLANTEKTAKASPHATVWRNISIHKASIVGVEYGQTVFYRVSGYTNNNSKVLNFTNWIPSPGDNDDDETVYNIT